MKSLLKFSALGCLLLAGCNKDEEIIRPLPPEETLESMVVEVVDYTPAPGQFINDPSSGFTRIETPEEACSYASGRLEAGQYVSLGAFGGYIAVKCLTPVSNNTGPDFYIAGNATDTSSEPGIVWVMADVNGNGLPDDQWYELKGSRYGKEGFETGYSVTYHRPEKPGMPVWWTDNRGSSGEIPWMSAFHKQDYYYPAWIAADSYTLTGSRLPENAELDPTTGIWSLKPFEWGYADNYGEDRLTETIGSSILELVPFDLSDAVDTDGRALDLSRIDFIKVQTAVQVVAGVIGEGSTEICGFYRSK